MRFARKNRKNLIGMKKIRQDGQNLQDEEIEILFIMSSCLKKARTNVVHFSPCGCTKKNVMVCCYGNDDNESNIRFGRGDRFTDPTSRGALVGFAGRSHSAFSGGFRRKMLRDRRAAPTQSTQAARACRQEKSGLSRLDETGTGFEAMTTHLDTNYLILLTTDDKVGERVGGWISEGIVLKASAMAWAEFCCGPVDKKILSFVVDIVSEIVPVDVAIARAAAHLFQKTGRRSRSLPDCIIAATAIADEAAVATHNRADFTPFVSYGLRIV